MSALDSQLRAFAAHLRAPGTHPPPPGIEDRRLAVYRDLFLSNIRSLLASNFPVLRTTLGETAWLALTQAFHAGFRSHTPLFTGIGEEFVRFLGERQASDAGDAPWMHELAHYEWVELAVQIADDPVPAHDASGDLVTGMPLASPFAWPLAYAWPVHRIAPDRIPGDTPPAAPTLLLVRRDPAGDVRFSELSPLVYRLLALLDEDPAATGRDVLLQLAREAGAEDVDPFLRDGTRMLQRLRDEGTLLGTR